jgi:hypothetical protein
VCCQQLTLHADTAAAAVLAVADLSCLLTWQCADELALPQEGGRLEGTIRGGPQHIPPVAAAAAAAA